MTYTNKEAAEILEGELEDLSSARGSDYSGVLALKHAISALQELPDEQAVRPNAIVVERRNEDGSRTWRAIEYACPVCGGMGFRYKTTSYCYKCGKHFDWGDHKPVIEVQYSVKW